MPWVTKGLAKNHKICNTPHWTRYGTDDFLGLLNRPKGRALSIKFSLKHTSLDPDGWLVRIRIYPGGQTLISVQRWVIITNQVWPQDASLFKFVVAYLFLCGGCAWISGRIMLNCCLIGTGKVTGRWILFEPQRFTKVLCEPKSSDIICFKPHSICVWASFFQVWR